MRVVFMGTPAFAVPSLEKLAASHEVALVLTRPDAVRSRGKRLEPSPVKARALELGLPVAEANRVTPEVLAQLEEARADVFCVAAYGCILPDAVLTMAPLGCVNVHASLLPRWRGAAPIQRAILAGDAETGVSIMRIGHGVDTGAYCLQGATPVAGKTAAELTDELARMGADLLLTALDELAQGTCSWTEQDEALVTHAPKIEKSELRLDPASTVEENVRRVLASGDAAPARCAVAGKALRVLAAHAADPAQAGALPTQGSYALARKQALLGCADGALALDAVKPDGKRAMDAAAWAAGLREKSGSWGVLS